MRLYIKNIQGSGGGYNYVHNNLFYFLLYFYIQPDDGPLGTKHVAYC
jgi:hypothetical protein